MNYNRHKQAENISITCYKNKSLYIVKVYNFEKNIITYKKDFKDPHEAVNHYDNIQVAKGYKRDIKGREEYLTIKLNK